MSQYCLFCWADQRRGWKWRWHRRWSFRIGQQEVGEPKLPPLPLQSPPPLLPIHQVAIPIQLPPLASFDASRDIEAVSFWAIVQRRDKSLVVGQARWISWLSFRSYRRSRSKILARSYRAEQRWNSTWVWWWNKRCFLPPSWYYQRSMRLLGNRLQSPSGWTCYTWDYRTILFQFTVTHNGLEGTPTCHVYCHGPPHASLCLLCLKPDTRRLDGWGNRDFAH